MWRIFIGEAYSGKIMALNKKIGSVLIIAGTAIGAGMLALPIVTASLGFVQAIGWLFVCWASMLWASHLILHVNMAFPERSNFGSMAKKTIGRAGYSLTWVSYLLLLYSLTAAYTTGGSALIQQTMMKFFHVEIWPPFGAFLFVAILGIVVYFETRSVDYATRLLMGLKMGAFLLLVIFLSPHVQMRNLLTPAEGSMSWLKALPILLTSFGFHVVIPNLRDYLHSNVKNLRWVFLWGVTSLFAVYLLWEWVVLGIAPELTQTTTVTDMVTVLSAKTDHSIIGFAIDFFADIAMTTSFLGVSLSLFHFIRDGLHLNHKRFQDQFVTALFTFVPPLCFAWFFPQGFVMALNYAGVFVAILIAFIPLWMAHAMRKKGIESAYPFEMHWIWQVLLLFLATAVIVAQFVY